MHGGPLPEEEEREDTIVVPRVNHGIFGSEYYDLCLAIDPLEHSSNYGVQCGAIAIVSGAHRLTSLRIVSVTYVQQQC